MESPSNCEEGSEMGETDEDVDVDTVDDNHSQDLSLGSDDSTKRKSERKRRSRHFGEEFFTENGGENRSLALSARRKRQRHGGKAVEEDKRVDAKRSQNTALDNVSCIVCGSGENEAELLLCDGCDKGFHLQCLTPSRKKIPKGDWFCKRCKREHKKKWKEHYKTLRSPSAEREKDTETATKETASPSTSHSTNHKASPPAPSIAKPASSSLEASKAEASDELEVEVPCRTKWSQLLDSNERAARQAEESFALQRRKLFEQFATDTLLENTQLVERVHALEREKLQLSKLNLEFQKEMTQCQQEKLALTRENGELKAELDELRRRGHSNHK